MAFPLLVGFAACGGRSVGDVGGSGDADSEDAGSGATTPAPNATAGDPAPVATSTPPTRPVMPVPSGTTPGEPRPPTAPTPSAPSGDATPAPSGSAGAPGVPPPDVELPPNVEASELVELWRVEVTGTMNYFDPFEYEGAVVFGLSADGTRVELGGHSSVAEFDAVTGAELSWPVRYLSVLAREAGASLELSAVEDRLVLRDFGAGTQGWEVPAPVGLELAAFAESGRSVVTLACDESTLRVQRFTLDEGVAEDAVDLGACERLLHTDRMPRSLAVLPDERVLVGGGSTWEGERGVLFDVDFARGQVTERRVLPESDDFVVEVVVAPGDAGVVLVGSDEMLRFYPDARFETPRLSFRAPLPYFSYYVPPLLAPLGISSDARYLATIHEDGSTIVLRRASDGAVLASAEPPPAKSPYVPTVPVLAAFGSGDRLAVLWLGYLALYQLR